MPQLSDESVHGPKGIEHSAAERVMAGQPKAMLYNGCVWQQIGWLGAAGQPKAPSQPNSPVESSSPVEAAAASAGFDPYARPV